MQRFTVLMHLIYIESYFLEKIISYEEIGYNIGCNGYCSIMYFM
jgi:hypothetical protein